MRVKVRAVIMQDGKLVVSRERRRGVEHVLLPGGRVQDRESISEAFVREVAEETGLDVAPERLLYVAEVVGSYGVHDLNLVWLAGLRDDQFALEPRAGCARLAKGPVDHAPDRRSDSRPTSRTGGANKPWLGKVRASTRGPGSCWLSPQPSLGAISSSATNASSRYSRYRPSGPAWMLRTSSAARMNAPVIGR